MQKGLKEASESIHHQNSFIAFYQYEDFFHFKILKAMVLFL